MPRNSSTMAVTCQSTEDQAPAVDAQTPAPGATDVPVDTAFTISFTEDVNVAGDWFYVTCGASPHALASTAGGPQDFTLTVNPPLPSASVCTARVVAGLVTDLDSNDPPDAMLADEVWSFTTMPLQLRIRDVQGAGHLSPYAGQIVSVPGIVTAVRNPTSGTRGFYFQDPEPDADPATSEGIFVFTNAATTVEVGQTGIVTGTVDEYRPGGTASTNASLTITELKSPTYSFSGTAALPAPVLLGEGGRVPPSSVIEDDATNVEVDNTFDPAADGIDFYESLEGMLVQVNDAVATGTTRFGEIPVLADNGESAGLRTVRGGVRLAEGDGNPERIILDDEVLLWQPLAMPDVTVGAQASGPITGTVDYSFNNYKVMVTQVPAFEGDLVPETTAGAGADHLSIAAFNVENLDALDPQTKFDKLASILVENLDAPDIVAVEEIQDNSGAMNNGVVAAGFTWARLITTVQSIGGPTYAYRQIDPANNQDGGEPGGNIRVGFLFDPTA